MSTAAAQSSSSISASLPKTMRAWQYTTTRPTLEANLKLNPSVPLPILPTSSSSSPSTTHHLVRITATALNPVDYKLAEFLPETVRSLLLRHRPATPGIDFAGVVVRPASSNMTNNNVPALKPGQRVFGVCGTSPLAAGALAEYAACKVDCAVPIPEGVESVHVATVGVAGLTAYQSILPYVQEIERRWQQEQQKKGNATSGPCRVFINGGSGGVGVFGIQIAKAAGCYVATTCSTRNVELCRRIGADLVIDYTKEDVVEALKKATHTIPTRDGDSNSGLFDHAVDNVGANPSLWWRSHDYLHSDSGAVYVLVAGNPSLSSFADTLKRKLLPSFLGGIKGAKVVGFWPKPNVADLSQLGKWMAEGKVQAIIEQRWPFEKAPEAFERLRTGRARGKVVIHVVGDDGGESSK